MKLFLKITSTFDDVLIQVLIDTATEWGEKYTGREFRANQWNLLLDTFTEFENSSERFQGSHLNDNRFIFLGFDTIDRIELKRDPVDIVDSVQYLLDDVFTTVSSTIFYLKKNTQSSEILLFEDQEWPTDVDNREQAIKITFTTKAYRCLNEIKTAIKLHASNLYTNRGDCDDSAQSAKDSGATIIYDQFRISRV